MAVERVFVVTITSDTDAGWSGNPEDWDIHNDSINRAAANYVAMRLQSDLLKSATYSRDNLRVTAEQIDFKRKD